MARGSSIVARAVFPFAVGALLAGLIAAAVTALAGPLYRQQVVSLVVAFTLLRWGFWIGAAASVAGLIGFCAAGLARRFAALLPAVLALAFGGGTSVWLHGLYALARSAPPIHDVATDPMHPPQFVTLATAREASPNGLVYGGGSAQLAAAEEGALARFFASPAGRTSPRRDAAMAACARWSAVCLAAVQRAYYPELRPLALPNVPPDQAFAAALATARAMGWRIAAADAANGHLEATATSAWFGFKDDVAIDVGGDSGGSVVNVRSASRLGLSDIGENARRIREYLLQLRRRLAGQG